MRVQLLFDDAFQVVAAMDGDACETNAFLTTGQATTKSSREGLVKMLSHVAQNGLHASSTFQGSPAAWFHLANQEEEIYEFIKGDLRLFFFKGEGRQIAVCTTGVLKKGQKADLSSVNKAIALRKEYFALIKAKTIIEVINP